MNNFSNDLQFNIDFVNNDKRNDKRIVFYNNDINKSYMLRHNILVNVYMSKICTIDYLEDLLKNKIE